MKNFLNDFFKQLLFSIITAIITFLVAYLDMWLKNNSGSGVESLDPNTLGFFGGSLRASWGSISLIRKYS